MTQQVQTFSRTSITPATITVQDFFIHIGQHRKHFLHIGEVLEMESTMRQLMRIQQPNATERIGAAYAIVFAAAIVGRQPFTLIEQSLLQELERYAGILPRDLSWNTQPISNIVARAMHSDPCRNMRQAQGNFILDEDNTGATLIAERVFSSDTHADFVQRFVLDSAPNIRSLCNDVRESME